MKYIKLYELFDFEEFDFEEKDPNSISDKDMFWRKNYKILIEITEEYENCGIWEDILKGDDLEYVYSSTYKHQALFLLHIHSISELEDMVKHHVETKRRLEREDNE